MATPTPVPAPPTPPRYTAISLDDLYTKPDPVWLIEHWCMRQTITLLTGPSESFKTFIAMDLAMKAASPEYQRFGPHWISRDRATASGGGYKVLYVIGESQGAAKFRFLSWEQYHGSSVDRDLMRVHDNRVDIFQAPDDVEKLIELEDPDIVIFDTWSRNTYGMDENSKKDVDVAMNLAHKLKMGGSKGGRSIIFIHHPTKDGKAYRGHTSMLNDSDVMIETERFDASKDNPVAPFYVKVKSMRQKETDDFLPYWAKLDTWNLLDSAGKPIPKESGDGYVSSLVITDTNEEPTATVTVGEVPKADQVEQYLRDNPGAKPKDIQLAVWGKPGSNVYGVLKQLGNIPPAPSVETSTSQPLEDL